MIDYANPLVMRNSGAHYFKEYGVCVGGHLVDFALKIRGLQEMEFNAQDALMSMMMEVAARESVLRDGARVVLPLAETVDSDRRMLEELRQELGVDPMDVDAMLSFQHGKP